MNILTKILYNYFQVFRRRTRPHVTFSERVERFPIINDSLSDNESSVPVESMNLLTAPMESINLLGPQGGRLMELQASATLLERSTSDSALAGRKARAAIKAKVIPVKDEQLPGFFDVSLV
jgi:hypothetical protein